MAFNAVFSLLPFLLVHLHLVDGQSSSFNVSASDVSASSIAVSTSVSASASASFTPTSTVSEATSASSTSAISISLPPGTIVTTPLASWLTGISAAPTSASFVPIGSIPRNYTNDTLQSLWDLVGSIQAPPFTTTVPGDAPVTLPASAPPVYPTWYAPAPQDVLPSYTFPADFKFGVASAAFQVEGAAQLEGKGPSGWDWAGHQPGFFVDGTNGDIGDLQYLLYKTDLARTAALGFNTYSFSVSWARIFPFGTHDSPVNQAGLDHYSDLIDYSLSLGVEPVLTLFHWDIPLALSAYYGGATSEEFVTDFANYAKTVFQAYNGRVKTWYTFNEPKVYCSQLPTYPFNTTLSSNVTIENVSYYCAYYVLKAHAAAVKIFRELGIEGEIAYKNDGYVGRQWRTNSSDDAAALERSAAFYVGMFSEPVYGSGDWPALVTATLNASLLPRFSEAEKAAIRGSADFFAIDLYRAAWVAAPPNGVAACAANASDPNWPACYVEKLVDAQTGWPVGIAAETTAAWLFATPQNLRHELGELKRRWPFDKIYISEFGFSNPEEGVRTDLAFVLDDAHRVNYYITYLGEFLKAIHDDGIPLGGTFAWAMIDNIEWSSGTSTRYGLQYVNYTSLERTFKRSALALYEFYQAHL